MQETVPFLEGLGVGNESVFELLKPPSTVLGDHDLVMKRTAVTAPVPLIDRSDSTPNRVTHGARTQLSRLRINECDRFVDRAVEYDLPSLKDDAPLAELLDLTRGVADYEHRLACRSQHLHAFCTLSPKGRIADRQNLIDEKHIEFGMDGYGEAEPRIHARGIMFDFGVYEVAYLRELEDILEALFGLRLAHAKDCRIEVDIVASREVWIETGTDLKKTSNTATGPDPTVVGTHNTGNEFQGRRFTGSISAK
ncbi:hypothetical protein GCM10009805_05460 [Leucobacter chromiireducens subsp. solipictus]